MKNTFNTSIILITLWVFASFNACKQAEEIKPLRRDIVDAVFASGHIENMYQYSVNANVDGFLQNLGVKEGDKVKSGQKLFYLSNEVQNSQVQSAKTNLEFAEYNASMHSPQIEQLKLQIDQAEQKKQVDSMNYLRYSRLVKTQAVSKQDADNVRIQYLSSKSNLGVLQNNLHDLMHTLKLNQENAKTQLEIQKETNNYYFIQARAAGTVLSISKKVGDYAKKGDLIAQIGSGIAIAKLYIAEDDIHRVALGQKVLISLNSNKDSILQATIIKIYPSFDQTDQSFLVDAEFKNPNGNYINGTQLQANIILGEKKNALVIPSYCLGTGDFVNLKGQKEKVPVKTGIKTLEFTEILSGLNETDILTLPK